jgi:hypothetical protein
MLQYYAKYFGDSTDKHVQSYVPRKTLKEAIIDGYGEFVRFKDRPLPFVIIIKEGASERILWDSSSSQKKYDVFASENGVTEFP